MSTGLDRLLKTAPEAARAGGDILMQGFGRIGPAGQLTAAPRPLRGRQPESLSEALLLDFSLTMVTSDIWELLPYTLHAYSVELPCRAFLTAPAGAPALRSAHRRTAGGRDADPRRKGRARPAARRRAFDRQ